MQVRSQTASQQVANAGSSAVSRGCAISSAVRSTSMPAALSLRTASVVACAIVACCQTRDARLTTAASSGVSETSGSANWSGGMR